MPIIDLNNAEYSNRHGIYGGAAGDKDGIIYEDEYWIVKYPKNTRSMSGDNLSEYTTSPLSEYIGSQIYTILGIPVHETFLGERNGKIVVACKDFCKYRGSLMEMRTIKNAAYKELSEELETKLIHSTSGDIVNLEELMIHFEKNPILNKVNGIQERFWNCCIVDILIDNNDRNNGNWGLLFDEKDGYSIAPVYDNGNSFENKLSEEKIKELLSDSIQMEMRAIGSRTIYSLNDHILSAKKMLNTDNIYSEPLKKACIELTPKITESFDCIKQMIEEIPEHYNGLTVCSQARKKLYIDNLSSRINQLIIPFYNKCIENNK